MYSNKMKRIFTILIIGFITLMTVGAKAQVKSYFGFFGGLSVPQGDFAATSYDNNKAGFAKKGITFGLDGAVYLYKNLGLGATIAFNDQGQMSYNDVSSIAAGYTATFAADQGTVTAVGRYHYATFLLGPQYSFTFGQFIIDLRASGGILKVYSTPAITSQLTGVAEQSKIFFQRSASATVLGYGGNLGLRYKLSDNVFLTLRGNYVNSQGPSITNDERTSNNGRLVTKQPITALQTTFGLSFGL